ncbi:hypothetical protein FNJ84_14230 [Paracoccus sp. M683]|uniref:hypothetical protein n=1 Tax=Paracoccus sp. M683 TaxID=2594268 RepID=UPI001196A5B5|nr:hypothetical protein [Paracoccus sp. M683]TRW95999.1 hypothetical protein FNJ84_14230 [Paracoccus sp. M683]
MKLPPCKIEFGHSVKVDDQGRCDAGRAVEAVETLFDATRKIILTAGDIPMLGIPEQQMQPALTSFPKIGGALQGQAFHILRRGHALGGHAEIRSVGDLRQGCGRQAWQEKQQNGENGKYGPDLRRPLPRRVVTRISGATPGSQTLFSSMHNRHQTNMALILAIKRGQRHV